MLKAAPEGKLQERLFFERRYAILDMQDYEQIQAALELTNEF